MHFHAFFVATDYNVAVFIAYVLARRQERNLR